MPTITEQQAAALWVQAGGRPADAPLAAVVAKHESGLRTDVVNGIGATGLWQIHPGGNQYKDPLTNARAAVAKLEGAGGRWGPNPWQVCSDASCSNLAGEATRNAGLFGDILKGFGSMDPFQGHNPLGGPDAPQGSGPLNTQGLGLDGIANALSDLVNTIKTVINKLGDVNTWKDAGKILLGLILLKIALPRLFTVVTS